MTETLPQIGHDPSWQDDQNGGENNHKLRNRLIAGGLVAAAGVGGALGVGLSHGGNHPADVPKATGTSAGTNPNGNVGSNSHTANPNTSPSSGNTSAANSGSSKTDGNNPFASVNGKAPVAGTADNPNPAYANQNPAQGQGANTGQQANSSPASADINQVGKNLAASLAPIWNTDPAAFTATMDTSGSEVVFSGVTTPDNSQIGVTMRRVNDLGPSPLQALKNMPGNPTPEPGTEGFTLDGRQTFIGYDADPTVNAMVAAVDQGNGAMTLLEVSGQTGPLNPQQDEAELQAAYAAGHNMPFDNAGGLLPNA